MINQNSGGTETRVERDACLVAPPAEVGKLESGAVESYATAAVASLSTSAIPLAKPVIPVSPVNKDVPPAKSSVGFLLLDTSLRPIFFNFEAVQILGYPEPVSEQSRVDPDALAERIGTILNGSARDGGPIVSEFRSGRRRYFCRAFRIAPLGENGYEASIAVLLERGPSGMVALSKISQQFNLTKREREVLEYLLQGMSSKDIATRMNVSPSTVKAFLRLIMIKTRASSRSAVVGKIMMLQG
jgi:DNA-binding CsgD family transcriptional regulator